MPSDPSSGSVYQPNEDISQNAYVANMDQYDELYKQSIDNPQGFWGSIARQFYWETPAAPETFLQYNFDLSKGPIFTKWMDGASTNICYNLLDRNVKNGHADTIAFYW